MVLWNIVDAEFSVAVTTLQAKRAYQATASECSFLKVFASSLPDCVCKPVDPSSRWNYNYSQSWWKIELWFVMSTSQSLGVEGVKRKTIYWCFRRADYQSALWTPSWPTAAPSSAVGAKTNVFLGLHSQTGDNKSPYQLWKWLRGLESNILRLKWVVAVRLFLLRCPSVRWSKHNIPRHKCV